MGIEDFNIQPATPERFTLKEASELVEGDYLPDYEAKFMRSYNARGSQDIVLVLDNKQEISVGRDEEFKVK